MKVELFVDIGLVGCQKKVIIDVEDDYSDAELDETGLDYLLSNVIDWGWKKVQP